MLIEGGPAMAFPAALLGGLSSAALARWMEQRLPTLLDDGLPACFVRPLFPQSEDTPSTSYSFDCFCILAFCAPFISRQSFCQCLGQCYLIATLLICAWIDGHRRILPDILTLPLLCTGLVLSLFDPRMLFGWRAFVGAAVGAGLGFSICWGARAGGGIFGLGDVKCLAAIGAWVGPGAVAAILLLASVSAAGFLLWRSAARSGQTLGFGPFLAGVTIVFLALSRMAEQWPGVAEYRVFGDVDLSGLIL